MSQAQLSLPPVETTVQSRSLVLFISVSVSDGCIGPDLRTGPQKSLGKPNPHQMTLVSRISKERRRHPLEYSYPGLNSKAALNVCHWCSYITLTPGYWTTCPDKGGVPRMFRTPLFLLTVHSPTPYPAPPRTKLTSNQISIRLNSADRCAFVECKPRSSLCA